MAKKASSDGPNKSQLIRDYMKANPSAGPKTVAEEIMRLHNVEVTAQFVSTVKANDKRKTGKKPSKRGRKPGSTPAVSSSAVSIESLKAAKKFIHSMGSAANAKAAVDLLAGLFD